MSEIAKYSKHQDWLDVVKNEYEQHHAEGGFLVLFPEYRPDLSRALANYLGLEFYDYRENVMQFFSWEASKISLEALTETLFEESEKTGLVVHNVEALLATKSDHQRAEWLAEFLTIDWSNPVVLPISIYQEDTVRGHPRVCDIELEEFPKQSFIMRLAM